MRSTRASTLIASAPATLDPAHQSEDGIRATSGSDVAPAVTTETVAEHTAMHLSHSSAQRVQPCAEGAGVRTLAVTSAGANSSHVSYDAAHGERSRTAPLAVTSEGANSQASGVFEAGLSEAEMRQRIRQGMGSGVGPRFDIVELAQCMAAFEQSVQEVRHAPPPGRCFDSRLPCAALHTARPDPVTSETAASATCSCHQACSRGDALFGAAVAAQQRWAPWRRAASGCAGSGAAGVRDGRVRAAQRRPVPLHGQDRLGEPQLDCAAPQAQAHAR